MVKLEKQSKILITIEQEMDRDEVLNQLETSEIIEYLQDNEHIGSVLDWIEKEAAKLGFKMKWPKEWS